MNGSCKVKNLIVSITGASGVILGVRLLEYLRRIKSIRTHLIISDWGKKIIEIEVERSPVEVEKLADYVYDNKDLAAPLSSGSARFDGMIIVPCSVHTLSMVANGLANDLITRAASVTLKERRRLVLVVRETPLNRIQILNMLRASSAGAIILPPALTFYHKPKKVGDLVDYVIGRILDQFNLEHDLYKRWKNIT